MQRSNHSNRSRPWALVGALFAVGLSSAAFASEGSQCTLCGYMFDKSAKQISSLKSDGKTDDMSMIKAMKDACGTTQGHAAEECEEIVSAHGKALANSMRKNRAKIETCQQIGLCLKF